MDQKKVLQVFFEIFLYFIDNLMLNLVICLPATLTRTRTRDIYPRVATRDIKTYSNKVDKIAAYHVFCYDMGKNKGDCDRVMVKSLNMIAYGEMPQTG